MHSYSFIFPIINKVTGWEEWLKPIILSNREVEIGRTAVGGQPEQKSQRPYLNQWLGVVAHACHPSYAEKYK
jgi:hypothetical protein